MKCQTCKFIKWIEKKQKRCCDSYWILKILLSFDSHLEFFTFFAFLRLKVFKVEKIWWYHTELLSATKCKRPDVNWSNNYYEQVFMLSFFFWPTLYLDAAFHNQHFDTKYLHKTQSQKVNNKFEKNSFLRNLSINSPSPLTTRVLRHITNMNWNFFIS